MTDLSTALHKELQHATQEEDGGGCSCSSLSHGKPHVGPTPKRIPTEFLDAYGDSNHPCSYEFLCTGPILQVAGISRFARTRKYNQQGKLSPRLKISNFDQQKQGHGLPDLKNARWSCQCKTREKLLVDLQHRGRRVSRISSSLHTWLAAMDQSLGNPPMSLDS